MSLICPIRKKEVAGTPEERVRSSFIRLLLEKGFPKEWILVETPLKDLPHIQEKVSLDRRIDILCYKEKLEPLLLIECKTSFNPKDLLQLLGYNHHIRSPYIALVSSSHLDLRKASGEPASFKEFPSFIELQSVK